MLLAKIVARDGACTALGVRPLGTGFVMFVDKTNASLKPETMAIFTLAFASLKNN